MRLRLGKVWIWSMAVALVAVVGSAIAAPILLGGSGIKLVPGTNPFTGTTKGIFLDSSNRLTVRTGTASLTVPATTSAGSAKGDLQGYSGTNWVIRTVGTDGQCLQADSGQTSGLAWGSCGTGGGGGGYATIKNEGTSLTQRTVVNMIGAAVNCVDNSGSTRTDCTVTGGPAVAASDTEHGLGSATILTGDNTFARIGNGTSTGFATWTTPSLTAGTYWLQFTVTVSGNSGYDWLGLRVKLDGSTTFSTNPDETVIMSLTHIPISRRVSLGSLSAATHTIELEWQNPAPPAGASSSSAGLVINAFDTANFELQGPY